MRATRLVAVARGRPGERGGDRSALEQGGSVTLDELAPGALTADGLRVSPGELGENAEMEQARPVLLIDAANVVGSRPTGWWRDRPGAARALTARVRRAAADGTLPAPVVLVLEGHAKDGVGAGVADGVEVVHAPGHGDDTIAALAADAEEEVLLITADRGLAERVRRSGVEVAAPSWLLERLPS